MAECEKILDAKEAVTESAPETSCPCVSDKTSICHGKYPVSLLAYDLNQRICIYGQSPKN